MSTMIKWLSTILVIIGGLNWGLWGVLHIDAVSLIFGDYTLVSRIIYILVGLGAVYLLINLFNSKKA